MTNSQENTQNTGEDAQAKLQKEKAQETKDKAQEGAQATGGKAKETAQATGESARETAQVAGDKAQETMRAAGESTQAAGEKVKETAQATGESAREAAQAARGKTQETAQTAGGKAQETGGKVQETAKAAAGKVEAQMQATRERLPDTTPTSPARPPGAGGLKAESSAQDLKARLDWGEPALTIIDVRDRDTHNQGHITGALPIPMNQLVEQAQSTLETIRAIYVYGATDQETAQAASRLREAGFVNVAELKGGIDGWKAVAGPIDGSQESSKPAPQETNVVARVKDAIDKQLG